MLRQTFGIHARRDPSSGKIFSTGHAHIKQLTIVVLVPVRPLGIHPQCFLDLLKRCNWEYIPNSSPSSKVGVASYKFITGMQSHCARYDQCRSYCQTTLSVPQTTGYSLALQRHPKIPNTLGHLAAYQHLETRR